MARRLASSVDPALQKRVVSAAVLASLALSSLWLGGWTFAALIIVAIIGMAWEWGHLLPNPTDRPVQAAIAAAAVIPAAGVVLVTLGQPQIGLLTVAIGALAAAGAASALRIGEIGHIVTGVVYVGIPVVAIAWLDGLPPNGWLLVLWLLLVVWATDIFAYAVGRTIGGAKLAPRISPGKTWSGLAGGVAGAAAIGAAASGALGGSPLLAGLLAAVLAVVGQIGDLYESFLKRRCGVKDSSQLIPGHGGILDRLDSLMFAAPVYAVIVALAIPRPLA